MPGEPFIDYYQLLQIPQNAELEVIQRVYRMMTARYHPDNPQTGDRERYQRLHQAYEVLASQQARREYDRTYQARASAPVSLFALKEFEGGMAGEPTRRLGILCLLYNRRRSNPESAGLSILDLESLTTIAREHLLFTLWYLREAELARQDERTDFVITSRGVDFVERNVPGNAVLHELIQASETGCLARNETGPAPDPAREP